MSDRLLTTECIGLTLSSRYARCAVYTQRDTKKYMSILSNLFHSNAQLVGGAAKVAGAVTGNKQLTNLGHNITNPNVSLSNPTGILYSNNPAFTGPGAYGASAQRGGSQPTAQNQGGSYDPYSNYGDGSYGNSSGNSSAQSQADQQLQGLRNQAIDRIHAIQSAYDALTGSLQSSVTDKSNQLNQNYNQQATTLGDSYKDTANQLTGQYQAHGLGDSSYAGNAQDSANKTYNDNLTAINTDRNNSLSQLGQTLQQGQAQYAAGKNSYNDYLNNIGNYGATDLGTLLSNFGQTQQDLATQQAGQGTQAQYLAAINGVNPTINQGTSQLSAQLQQLANSSTPQFAKNTIAQGLISQAGITDPSQKSLFEDQFKQLTAGG